MEKKEINVYARVSTRIKQVSDFFKVLALIVFAVGVIFVLYGIFRDNVELLKFCLWVGLWILLVSVPLFFFWIILSGYHVIVEVSEYKKAIVEQNYEIHKGLKPKGGKKGSIISRLLFLDD